MPDRNLLLCAYTLVNLRIIVDLEYLLLTDLRMRAAEPKMSTSCAYYMAQWLSCHCPEISHHELGIQVLAQRSWVPQRIVHFVFIRTISCLKGPLKESLQSRLMIRNISKMRSFLLPLLSTHFFPRRNKNKHESNVEGPTAASENSINTGMGELESAVRL